MVLPLASKYLATLGSGEGSRFAHAGALSNAAKSPGEENTSAAVNSRTKAPWRYKASKTVERVGLV
jgi:hypothetical protein